MYKRTESLPWRSSSSSDMFAVVGRRPQRLGAWGIEAKCSKATRAVCLECSYRSIFSSSEL